MQTEQFMPSAAPSERRTIMADHAISVEDTTYLKPLSAEEIDQHRETITNNFITYSDLEEEKKEAMANFKAKMDPIVKENKVLLTEVRTKHAKVQGRLYHIPNHEKSIMETYDEDGYFVSSRRLLPTEKQGRLFIPAATGTNGQ